MFTVTLERYLLPQWTQRVAEEHAIASFLRLLCLLAAIGPATIWSCQGAVTECLNNALGAYAQATCYARHSAGREPAVLHPNGDQPRRKYQRLGRQALMITEIDYDKEGRLEQTNATCPSGKRA